jgi:hypothetical protein
MQDIYIDVILWARDCLLDMDGRSTISAILIGGHSCSDKS